jgi:hypothetical protein
MSLLSLLPMTSAVLQQTCFLHVKKGFHQVYLEPDKFQLLLATTMSLYVPSCDKHMSFLG